ncbi:MAG: hypothetical protein O3C43_03100 [Verrucomicrobia bacterium]|nr:hypothetical protein [Verrucomicrobiota bacterium]MDA1065470.1 hypothetical protein [Verrucomicrobiota bacterium]
MKFITILALILSAIALALPFVKKAEGPVLVQATGKKNTQELRDELLRLQKRLAVLEKASTAKVNETVPLPKLQEQVAELSTFQGDLAEYALNIDPLDVIGTTEREIETAYAILMDESKSPGERAKQAALLKRYELFDEEAINSMKNLFFTSEDLYGKAAALSALKGHISPDIRDGVLESFSQEVSNGYKNARFRYSGIEALEPLLPNPEVESMLTQLAQNDPEPKIAARAAKSVGLPITNIRSGDKEVDSVKPPADGAKRDG